MPETTRWEDVRWTISACPICKRPQYSNYFCAAHAPEEVLAWMNDQAAFLVSRKPESILEKFGLGVKSNA